MVGKKRFPLQLYATLLQESRRTKGATHRVAPTKVGVLLRFARYIAHGVLRQRSDGEAGVDARIGGHD